MLIAAAILFPMIAGAIVSAGKNSLDEKRPSYIAVMLITDFLAVTAMLAGERFIPVSFTENVPMLFVPDGLGRYILTAGLILYTAVCFYAFEYMKMEEKPEMFFTFFFISLGALVAVCLSGNLVTMYLSFELMTLTTVPLVLQEMSEDAVSAGLKYLFYSVAGALMGLLAVFFVYHFAGSADTSFVYGGFLTPDSIAGHEKLFLGVMMAGIIGFGTKAGLYPMHGWLPTAHPIAPAPSSALLSGIVAKAGVLAIIRLVYFSAGADLLRGTWVQYTWMSLAMLTIFMGSMMAFREKILKKRLAYSSISQISYILLGLSFLSSDGLNGGLLHLMGHAAAKGCLFLVAGIFIYKLGVRRVTDLRGVGRRMPVTLWCFTIVSLSLIGIPPLAGFLSKWVIASAAIGSGVGIFRILAPAVLLVSALLTAGYLLPVTVNGFFPGHAEGAEEHAEEEFENAEPSSLMTIPLICLSCVTLIVGIWGMKIIALLGF